LNEDHKAADKLSRRSFLLSSGATAAASLTEGIHTIRVASAAEYSEAPLSSAVLLVNLLQGTDSTSQFSRGNTLPIAARPFGMAHWTLQSRANTPWMFQPGERRIQGFRSTHHLRPWLGDYGHAVLLPFCGTINPDPSSRASSFRPEDAMLAPHSIRLRLLRYGIEVELIPTECCALMTMVFARPEGRGFLVEIPGDHVAAIDQDVETRTLRFTSVANAGGVPEHFATYYVLLFSEGWENIEVKKIQGSTVALVRFTSAKPTLEVRVGTSFISFDQAGQNLEREVGARTPDTLRREGEEVWNKHLGLIELTGGTERQKRTFYSCMYRTMLFPRMWHEPDASGAMWHRSPYNGKVVAGVMYADHGYWDVYRAWYPLMTVLLPERLAEILQAWVNAYKEGGWLPQFPCPGYRACMTGSLIDSVFGDAAAKNIGGFDLAVAYAGLKKHAMERGNPDAGYGRRGIEQYMKYGYSPADLVEQSAAETVDAAYGDFCIAQVARSLGYTEDYEMFSKRSESWRNLFDEESGFIRGKRTDGAWVQPFDPVTWGDPYVEGSAWQHRWDVPHNMAGLIEALGGPENTVSALKKMLTAPPDFNVGIYGKEIHEMSEMAAIRFGQYAHSNQPVHHVLYLFAAAGHPELTRLWTSKVMDELYTPDSFAGDEDTGSMAAWYILSALGFYPHCPGKAEYTLGRALFPRATLHLSNGNTLQIEDAVKSEGAGAVVLNGKRLKSSILSHAEVLAGGRLRFE